jgi:hypothetical protein
MKKKNVSICEFKEKRKELKYLSIFLITIKQKANEINIMFKIDFVNDNNFFLFYFDVVVSHNMKRVLL